ncbi:MAG TPA: amidohydrolase [Candidatus Limnocylindrales bacterium]|nr:amidohydrolase [Candidatus Limnocylindrales bacterium]
MAAGSYSNQATANTARLILTNAKIATQDDRRSFARAVAMEGGRFLAVGTDEEVLAYRDAHTTVIDARGRTIIPGLIDSHLHLIRGGLSYNTELRWDGVPSLSDALRMLKEQAKRTPPGQWVRVIGGWSEFQFAERRMPTLAEINAISSDVPVFILHLYDRALLNGAAVRVLGYTKDTPEPAGGHIERDKAGNPTGLLIAAPNAAILYGSIAAAPKLSLEHQYNSSRHFMREMNRLGITGCVDAGGGYQRYPEDYEVMTELHRRGEMTVRISYNLFTQHAKDELADFSKWTSTERYRQGDDMYRLNGAGEMLTFSAADFEDFLQPRPDLSPDLEPELTAVVRLLAEKRWPFRLHATYDESITRFLNVFEAVDRDVPFGDLRWFFDHAETVSEKNLDRIKALGGGIAVQHRMAFQGEYFMDRYGEAAVSQSPPIRKMLDRGIPVGAGTDGTRVASYNPFVSLYWMVSGRTVGGTAMYGEENRLDRMGALRRYTVGSAWFSGDEAIKGAIMPGRLADLAVLTNDYFEIPEGEIKGLESVLTVVGGNIVYAAGDFAGFAQKALPVLPEWSPVAHYGGYRNADVAAAAHAKSHAHGAHQHWRSVSHGSGGTGMREFAAGMWGSGCPCWAF